MSTFGLANSEYQYWRSESNKSDCSKAENFTEITEVAPMHTTQALRKGGVKARPALEQPR